MSVSQELNRLIHAGVDGNYRDPFFNTDNISLRPLKARLQERLVQFAGNMHTKGHAFEFKIT